MKYFVTLPSGREHVVDILEDASGGLKVTVDGNAVHADSLSSATASREAASILVDGRVVELWLEASPPKVGVIADGRRFFAQVESERMRIRAAGKPAGAEEGVVTSPMPGRVVRVLVAEGADVTEGQPIIVVEAMKMENELVATRAGKVAKIHVAAGATVEGGASLIEIE
ncbi:MAG: biotin/lipoyl-binding protein [Polyangiaceae bacterium]|nr:biotin/lipoyl-binding protein [Polyangiaceae bacterium]